MSAYVLDTETTDKDAPQVIEAAWIRMPQVVDLVGASDQIDLHPMAHYQTFEERYRPSKAISFGALAVHHILPSELEHCPPHTQFQLPDDVEYLIGHSIDYDWQVAGAPAHVKRICTHAIAQHLFDDCDSTSLVALLYLTAGANDLTRQRVKQAHGAMADCWNALEFLRLILARKPEITTWSALWAWSEECRIPLRMPLGKNRGALLTDLDSSEIYWYLDRDFIDQYLRVGMERVIDAREPPALAPPPAPASAVLAGTDFDDDLPF